MGRKPILKDYISQFKLIISKADKIVENNNFNSIEFYGIALSYLNYYDQKKFSIMKNELYYNNPENLYDILLIYYTHFKYPINQDFDFLINLLVKF